MVLALALTLLMSWILLWGVFHLAGGAIQIAPALGLALLVLRLIRASAVRAR